MSGRRCCGRTAQIVWVRVSVVWRAAVNVRQRVESHKKHEYSRYSAIEPEKWEFNWLLFLSGKKSKNIFWQSGEIFGARRAWDESIFEYCIGNIDISELQIRAHIPIKQALCSLASCSYHSWRSVYSFCCLCCASEYFFKSSELQVDLFLNLKFFHLISIPWKCLVFSHLLLSVLLSGWGSYLSALRG